MKIRNSHPLAAESLPACPPSLDTWKWATGRWRTWSPWAPSRHINDQESPFLAVANGFERKWLFFCLIFAFGLPLYAATPWRFWTKADGLAESVVFGLTADNSGRVVIKPGDVPSISAFDGYQIIDIRSPHVYGRFLSSPENELWTFDAHGIKIHDASGWHEYADADIAEFAKNSSMAQTSWFFYSVYRDLPDQMDVVPLGDNRGLIMFPDRLVEWNRATGRKRVIRVASQTELSRFRAIEKSSDHGYWLTGSQGLAHLKEVRGEIQVDTFQAPRGLTDLVSPIEGMAGEVFVTALRRDGKRCLLRFAGRAWKERYVGTTGHLRGWRGPDGAIWVQNDRKIIQLEGNSSRNTGEGTAITGLTTAVVSEPGKPFWLGTTEGVARYSPPLWRTPPSAAWADGAVSAITGDSKGRIWFLSGGILVLNDHERWRRFELPPGNREAILTDNIVVLDNGDLAIRGNSLAEMIIFSPESERFHVVRHPEGKRIGWIANRSGGVAWVQIFESGANWRLEKFDGSHFLPGGFGDLSALKDLKAILEARNGDIWLGASDALGVVRDGRLQIFNPSDGFTDTGVFSVVEKPGGNIMLGGRNYITEYNGKSFRTVHEMDIAESMCISPDGTLWAASGSGIHRYDPGKWITNTTEDGLPSPAARKIYSDFRGRVWAGTSRGISLLYPDADLDPPVTNIPDDQNLRETPPGGEVRLTFSGVDKWKFTAPERLAFSWRIDQSDWSDFKVSQFASFKRLNSGGHSFEVRAMDRNGNVDPSPAKYQFEVLLPWYWQKRFLAVAAVAIVLIAVLVRLTWRHHRRLAFQSGHDPLTGLANRAVFDAKFQDALAEARENNILVAVLLLDLDRFKPINDTMGHVVGDLFLKEVSRRLGKAIRRQDTLSRLGGDEFGILMPGLHNRSEAESMAEAVLFLLRQPYHIESYELAGSASLGISLFPEHGEDAVTLHRLADMAMYQCKARNKDDYAVFDAEVSRLDFRSAQMAGLIREALAMGYFRVDYQPLQALDGELVGLEALVRLQHPRLGHIPPEHFITVAEDTGLIGRIGEWVLNEACTQMARWHTAGHHRLRVSVNVSTVQLTKPDFASTVKTILHNTSLNPSALTLEITETAMMRKWNESRAQIEQLRPLGITVALDDFGTGYSTLNSLHLLPVDYIKMDKSFVERLDGGTDGFLVVQAIVNLVHKLGFKVVAEGVELPEQLAGLKAVGCDLLQGFLLGRPLSATEAEGLFGSAEILVASRRGHELRSGAF
jgi:diguanylate cyclase (GGDEF)-like protein